jgi:GxxExxY protein
MLSDMDLSESEINHRTGAIINSALKVHSLLGPGLLESAYKACLAHELRKRGFDVTTEFPIPLIFDGLRMDVAYKADLLIDSAIIVEAKCVDRLAPIHDAQILSYLKLSGLRAGLLINFHELHLKDGIRRKVNNL